MTLRLPLLDSHILQVDALLSVFPASIRGGELVLQLPRGTVRWKAARDLTCYETPDGHQFQVWPEGWHWFPPLAEEVRP